MTRHVGVSAVGTVGSRIDRHDVFLATIAFAVTFAYLIALPPVLVAGDEANYLHEAKRVARGEVLYRDVFELTTPGWVFLVATLFRLFGTDIATAKVATAVIHALTVAMLFLACRRLGVRRALAWPLSLLYVAIAMPAWPMASQHWLATMLSVAVLLAATSLPRAPASWSVVLGVLVGLLVSTHQRGAVVGAGLAVWLLAGRLLLGRQGRSGLAIQLIAPVVWFGLGSLLVLVPLTLYLIATAGAEPLWGALIVHPLTNYPWAAGWGQPGFIAAAFSFPILLRYAPASLIVPACRLGSALWRAGRRAPTTTTVVVAPDETSLLLLSTTLGAAAIASIRYYPDTAHIGFIFPFFLVALGQSLEWGARRVSRPGKVARRLGYTAVLLLLVLTTIHLGRNLRAWHRLFPLRQDTAFGRIAIASSLRTEQLDDLRARLRHASSPSLFGYPSSASDLCLMVDARNPTRYEHFNLFYNTSAQIQEVLATLTHAPPTYFILNGALGPSDPVNAILDRHYTVVFAARGMDQFTILEPRATGFPAGPPGG